MFICHLYLSLVKISLVNMEFTEHILAMGRIGEKREEGRRELAEEGKACVLTIVTGST